MKFVELARCSPRRLLSRATGNLYVIEIAVAATTPAGFRKWRIAARNALDYRRREGRWWRDFGMIVRRSSERGGMPLLPFQVLVISQAFVGIDAQRQSFPP